jgi:hypothetical protein
MKDFGFYDRSLSRPIPSYTHSYLDTIWLTYSLPIIERGRGSLL